MQPLTPRTIRFDNRLWAALNREAKQAATKTGTIVTVSDVVRHVLTAWVAARGWPEGTATQGGTLTRILEANKK